MRNRSAHVQLLAATAIAPALLWGLVEFTALQWSHLRERLRLLAAHRAA